MNTNLITFQIEVEVEQGSRRYGYYPVQKGSGAIKGVFIRNTIVKMFHIEATKPEHAKKKAEKYGRVLTCQKCVIEDNIERKIKLDQQSVYQQGNPYNNALAMDELIWKKRNIRRANLNKDKMGY